MLDALEDFLQSAPLFAVFACVSLGYLIGKFKVGNFVLGGIAGTLIIGVLIGQFDIQLNPILQNVFFALFIYAVGFQGGPQFFRSLNLKSLNMLASAFLMCFVGLVVVLASAFAFNLDRGTAAGLAAGGLTQSAIIGTAGESINELDGVSAEAKETMQTNVAVGYAVTYIFGSLGPIIMATWFWPMIMGWNLRDEAKKLAKKLAGGHAALEPGEFEAVAPIDTRFYEITEGNHWAGKTVAEFDDVEAEAAIELVWRAGESYPFSRSTKLEVDDVMAVTGLVSVLDITMPDTVPEVDPPDGASLVEEHRDIIVLKKRLDGMTIGEIGHDIDMTPSRGAFVTDIHRMGHKVPALPNTTVHRGDEITLLGRPADLNRVEPKIGRKISAAQLTDFAFFGLGLALGVAIGHLAVKIGDVPLTLGTGGGALVSGLVFGWLRSAHPRFAALPIGASNFLRNFGLAMFVAAVGLTAGPQALTSIEQNGVKMLLLGVGVTLIPMLLVFPFSYWVLKIKNPIEGLGTMVGGRSANPGLAALLVRTGNSTPTTSFTICYAVANVFLTLWGPIIVGVVQTNPS